MYRAVVMLRPLSTVVGQINLYQCDLMTRRRRTVVTPTYGLRRQVSLPKPMYDDRSFARPQHRHRAKHLRVAARRQRSEVSTQPDGRGESGWQCASVCAFICVDAYAGTSKPPAGPGAPAAAPPGRRSEGGAGKGKGGKQKPKYSEVVDNSADKELIEMVERDILDANPNVRDVDWYLTAPSKCTFSRGSKTGLYCVHRSVNQTVR